MLDLSQTTSLLICAALLASAVVLNIFGIFVVIAAGRTGERTI
jgi:hypothetical protein